MRVQLSPAARKALAECLGTLCAGGSLVLLQGSRTLATLPLAEGPMEADGEADGQPDTAHVTGKGGLVMVLDVGDAGSDAAVRVSPRDVVKGGPVRATVRMEF